MTGIAVNEDNSASKLEMVAEWDSFWSEVMQENLSNGLRVSDRTGRERRNWKEKKLATVKEASGIRGSVKLLAHYLIEKIGDFMDWDYALRRHHWRNIASS